MKTDINIFRKIGKEKKKKRKRRREEDSRRRTGEEDKMRNKRGRDTLCAENNTHGEI